MGLKANVHICFLRSQNSENDQPNDNGPNALLKSCYRESFDEAFSGMGGSGIAMRTQAMTVPLFNEIIALAWTKFKARGATVIINSYKKTGTPTRCCHTGMSGWVNCANLVPPEPMHLN